MTIPMAIRKEAVHLLRQLLGNSETEYIVRLASKQDELELKNRLKLDEIFEEINETVVEDLSSWREIDEREIYERILNLLVINSFRTMESAIRAAEKKVGKSNLTSLAAPPKGRIPRSLSGLMKMWDEYRNREYIPQREEKLAKRIKEAYLKKVREVWEEESQGFRSGNTTNETLTERIQKAAKAPYSRAKMIVETETTRYYNAARKSVYDTSNDVTHYLFIAIRDARTTKWCKTRDGLVYEKGSDYLRKETPPIHWNCRSEIIPLSIMNPSHAKLIRDKSLQRGNRKVAPLPKGWVTT